MTKHQKIGKVSAELQMNEALLQWKQSIEKQISKYDAMNKHDRIGEWTVSQWLRFYIGQRNEISSFITILKEHQAILKNGTKICLKKMPLQY
jgi:hypothetical protein